MALGLSTVRGGRQQASPRLTLVACVLSSSLVGVDSMMTSVALPAIAEDMGAGLAAQQWVVAAFLLALGSLLLVGGALGDLYDRWLVFAVGTAGFGLAALVSALAPNVPVLVAGRLLQGAAAALLVPSVLAVISTTFDGEERSRAIGVWTAWSGVSIVVGPGLGGLLVDLVSWRAVYGVLVPASALVIVLIVRAAPAATVRTERRPLDRVGALLAVPVVGGPVLALIQAPDMGWGSPVVVGALVAGLLAGAGFVIRERTAAVPLLPSALFRIRTFTVLNLVTFVLYAALISSGVYTVLFLQQTAGYSPAVAGLASVVPVAVLFALSKRFGALADRFGPRPFVVGGSAVVAVGLLLLVRVDADAVLATTVLPSVLVHGLGLAMVVAPLTAGVLASVDDDHAGVASGINNAVARIGSLLGVAVIGLVISVQFTQAVDDELGTAALSTPARVAADQAGQRPFQTVPDADLGAGETRILTDALTGASVDAFRIGAGVLAGLACVAALLAVVGLPVRHRRFRAQNCPGGALVGAHPEALPAVAD